MRYSTSFVFVWIFLVWGCNSGTDGAKQDSTPVASAPVIIQSQDGDTQQIKIETKPVVRDPETNKGVVIRSKESPFASLKCCQEQIQPCCCDSVVSFYKKLLFNQINIKKAIDIKQKDPYFHACDSGFQVFRNQIHVLDSLKFGN